ncbi:hypothetical protein OKW24_001771 [Peribacillus simplex]|nr:hypothetical protein [Peribacillus simplex]
MTTVTEKLIEQTEQYGANNCIIHFQSSFRRQKEFGWKILKETNIWIC